MRAVRYLLMVYTFGAALVLSAPSPSQASGCPETGSCPPAYDCISLCIYDHCECLKACWNECCETDCQGQGYADCQTTCDYNFYQLCLPYCPF